MVNCARPFATYPWGIHVTEHVRQRNEASTTMALPRMSTALDHAATTVEVADDRTQILFRSTSTFMIGSSSFGPPFFTQFLEGCARGDFENRRVDVVVGTVDQGRLEVDQREKPASRPFPWPIRGLGDAGMYSFGTAPPTIADSNTKPVPGSPGSNTSLMRAN